MNLHDIYLAAQIAESDSKNSAENNNSENNNSENIYTAEETPIGTWVDGRTIYRIVLDYSNNPYQSGQLELPTTMNAEYFIKMDALGYYYQNGIKYFLYSVAAPDGGGKALVYYPDGNWIHVTGAGVYISHFILEYVKINDET